MKQSKTLVAAALFVLAACVAIYFFSRVGSPERLSPIDKVSHRAVPDKSSAPLVAVPATTLGRTRLDEPVVDVLVYREGVPVDGAAVLLLRPAQTRRDEEPRELIGSTANGVLSVPLAKLRNWKQVVARHNGAHGRANIRRGEGGVITIRMPVGHALSVEVVDAAGSPLPGCRVMTALQTLPARSAFLDESQVWAPIPRGGRDSVYGGVSDELGLLKIGGLDPGKYQIDVRKFGYLPDASCYKEISIPASANVQIKMMPVIAAAIVLLGDEIIEKRLRVPLSIPIVSGITTPLLDRVKQGLRARFEGAIIAVGVGRGRRERTGVLECFGRTSGWSTHRVPLRPLAMLEQPTTIHIPVQARDLTAEVVVVVRSATGAELKGMKLLLTGSGEHTYERNTFTLRSGEPGRVPVGPYTLRSSDALLRQVMIRRDIQIRSGSNREVYNLATEWRRLRVGVEKSGCSLLRGVVQLETAVGSRMIDVGRGSSPVWVPVGTVRLRAFLGSGVEPVAERVVDTGLDVQEETIVL